VAVVDLVMQQKIMALVVQVEVELVELVLELMELTV
jgi:hypothetical protein